MPRNNPQLPPDTRLLVTYDEGAAWWAAHYRPISARSLRRIPLETKLQGRNRLIVFASLKQAAKREFEATPTIPYQDAAPAPHCLKSIS